MIKKQKKRLTSIIRKTCDGQKLFNLETVFFINMPSNSCNNCLCIHNKIYSLICTKFSSPLIFVAQKMCGNVQQIVMATAVDGSPNKTKTASFAIARSISSNKLESATIIQTMKMWTSEHLVLKIFIRFSLFCEEERAL